MKLKKLILGTALTAGTVFAIGTTSANADEIYTIQSNDTLRKISKQFVGDKSLINSIVDANSIQDKNVIYAGEQLTIPTNGNDAKEQQAPVQQEAPVQEQQAPVQEQPAPVQEQPAAEQQPVETPAPSASADGSAIVAEAQKHMGTPYVWGGRTPDGFDCSGFTQHVYKQVTGRDIGGYTVPQENAGTQISVNEAQAGDLLFWGSKGGTYHVAISTGGSSFIHAPKPGDTVKNGDTQYFTPDFAVRM